MAQHLILGGTGNVGSAVTRALLERGESARVLTRSKEKASSLPAGAAAVIGDLADPDSYERAFAGAETIFLLNGIGLSELQEGLAAVNEAKRAKARRIVYLSIHDVEKGPAIPHFAAKIAVEGAIRASGVPFTILRPNNFFQNDYWYRDVLLGPGIYPQPFGSVGLSRVDVRDIAEAAANALTRPGHEGKTYALVGPRAWTAAETATEWSRALGREIHYVGDDLVAWGAAARQMLPAWAVYDFGLMFALFQREGLRATDAQLAETNAIVGTPPRGYEAFVRETAAQWKAPSPA